MSPSVIFSDCSRRSRAFALRFSPLLAIILIASAAHPGNLISVDDALSAAFPGGTFERETVFLTEDHLDHVERACGQKPKSALVTRFTARLGDQTLGWAYLDTHRVRTLPETVMVIIDPQGAVRRIEVVAFREPLDYLPPESWYAQFEGRTLDEDLELKRGIRPITGATLTARATTDAVRRLLSTHAAITGTGDGS